MLRLLVISGEPSILFDLTSKAAAADPQILVSEGPIGPEDRAGVIDEVAFVRKRLVGDLWA